MTIRKFLRFSIFLTSITVTTSKFEALSHVIRNENCRSTTIIHKSLTLLQTFLKCSASFGKFPRSLQILDINQISNVLDEKPNNYNSKLNFKHTTRFKSNCQIVVVLLGSNNKNEGVLLQQYINEILNPKRDFFFFLLKQLNPVGNTNALITNGSNFNWIWKLRHKFFYRSDLITCSLKSMTGSIYSNENDPHSVRAFLSGKSLQVTALEVDEIVKKGISVEGMFFNLMHFSSRYFNFTYDLEIPDYRGVTRLQNGTWTGPFADIILGKKDVVLGGGRTYERDVYFDYPTFLDLTGVGFSTAPPKIRTDFVAIFYIFPPGIWTLLIFFSMMTIFTICLSTLVYQRSFKISTAVVLTISPFLEQSSKSLGGSTVKLFLLAWSLMAVVIVNCYKCNFIAYITYPVEEEVPRTFKDLESRSDYKIQLMNVNASVAAFFKHTQNPIYVGIRSRLIIENDWLKCMSKAAFEDKTACINFDFVGQSVISKNLTLNRLQRLLEFSRDTAFDFNRNLQFPKNSKYVDSFSVIVRCLRDTGNLRKWVQDFYEVRRRRSIRWLRSAKGESQIFQNITKSLLELQGFSYVKPFGFKNVAMAFIMLSVGCSMGLGLFFLEVTFVITGVFRLPSCFLSYMKTLNKNVVIIFQVVWNRCRDFLGDNKNGVQIIKQ
ncbi:unnamed protein product [Allacma fusca]|uniref:Ionotropic receptor n=1 Tax=Allacma fusca TaxID=39272 RepID=A0A8J2L2F2_9HEXA|nr:unnamed protein product [Allacma fusca]